jgi:hypothetical protein
MSFTQIFLDPQFAVNFGRARQFQLITSGEVTTKMEVFKDEDEALSWLLA